MTLSTQIDPATVFAEHCRWGEVHGNVVALPSAPLRDPNPERCLRIGYVSPDLRLHPVARFMEPVLAHHDPARIEVFCYAQVARPDAVTQRLQKLVAGWRSTCGRLDREVAEQVRRDGIDILVDLAGHTANNRLRVFAYRPALVQVSYLGYHATTGLRSIDYYLSDAMRDPPGEENHYVEEVVRLPHGVCCFQPPAESPAVAPLPAQAHGVHHFWLAASPGENHPRSDRTLEQSAAGRSRGPSADLLVDVERPAARSFALGVC